MDYSLRAIQWAETYGITDYRVKGNLMIYNVSYSAYLSNPRYTVQHTIDLNTMKELPTKVLKRFDIKGYINRR